MTQQELAEKCQELHLELYRSFGETAQYAAISVARFGLVVYIQNKEIGKHMSNAIEKKCKSFMSNIQVRKIGRLELN